MIRSTVWTGDRFVEKSGFVHGAIWIDLVASTDEERETVRNAFQFSVPERVRMRAIEPSSRLVASEEHLVMTFVGMSAEAGDSVTMVTCILTEDTLLTIHPDDAPMFEAAREFRAEVEQPERLRPHDFFLALVDASIADAADRLTALGRDIDTMAAEIFDGDAKGRRSNVRVHDMMKSLGVRGTQIMRIQDSLTSLQRLSLFMGQHVERVAPDEDDTASLTAFHRDVRALQEFAEALDSKIEFLLDAMLGIITLDQNRIMMVLSMSAALFVPATLISSIFGMNFTIMPVLKWHDGFFLSIGAMGLAALFVGLIFRMRYWM